MTVSVIMVFLNAEQFIGEAIESVFGQSCRDWELLLVDDGSTDGSSALARKYAQEHPEKVRYLTHPQRRNRGISNSRNLGIAHAQGSYVAFLDSDDFWLPNKLEEQASILQAAPDASMIFGPRLEWHSWTGKAEDRHRDVLVPAGVDAASAPHAVDIPLLCLRDSNSTPAPSGIMVRRSALEAVGGFVGEADNLYDDQSFYFKFGLRYFVLTAGACWYKYRIHPNSCCAAASRDGRHAQARLTFLEWASRELDSSGLDRPDLRHALQNEIARHQPLSPYKRVLGRIPGVRSTWHLMRAVKDAWSDDSTVSVLEVQQDFSNPDPWSYTTNDLERVRHRGEAQMLDNVRGLNRFGRALEIGCAEGIFTELLAERCDSLLAADFSDPALARARQRCHWDGGVTFERLDLRNDPLPGVFDLIVAIHVLEYIRNPVTLRKVRERLVEGLRPGGYLLIGSCSIQDLKERAWWSRYMLRGGRRVNAFFAGHRKLSVVDSAVYPLPGSESHDLLFRKAQ